MRASLALFSAPALDAQTGTKSSKEEAVVLSPFEVNAEKDTGYRASSTLAGTRLCTDLRDVAASIRVSTKDFMNDIGANDRRTLFVPNRQHEG